MAYDEDLADRVRAALQHEDDVVEKRMFGGLAFMLGGHMAVGVSGQGGLMLRVDRAESDTLVAGSAAEPMEMGGRTLKGWLRLDAPDSDEELAEWVAVGVRYVRTLPPK